MTTKEKARPAVGAAEQAEKAILAGTNLSQNNFTIRQEKPQGKIERLLSHGRENAIPLQHLVSLTGLPARQVRHMIQAERLQGAPILADSQNGYYLPGSQQDIEKFYRSMLHRAAEITRVATAVKLKGRADD